MTPAPDVGSAEAWRGFVRFWLGTVLVFASVCACVLFVGVTVWAMKGMR